MWLRSLALACLVGAAFAGPVQRSSENQCAKQCHPPQHPKLGFVPGKAYVYDYKSENSITIAGIQKDNVVITASVEYHFLTSCEAYLKFKKVRIQQDIPQEEKEALIKQLELKLRFAYVDGKFEHVCPSPEESKLSLNLKKGCISQITNGMTDLDKSQQVKEEDSFGKCLVDYTVQNNGEKVITKLKDLKTCSNWPMGKTSFFEGKFPHSLLFKGHMETKQHIKNNDKIIYKVYSREQQKLRNPLKDGETLTFAGKIQIILTDTKPVEKQLWQDPVDREGIAYSVHEPRQGDRNVKELERVLKSMCSKNHKVIDMTVGKDFMKLVALVESCSYEELDKTYESLKDGTLCSSKKVRNIFADTLPVVATDPSIKLMVKMMVNNDATPIQRTLWSVVFTFKRHPTQETVAALIPLLKKDLSTSTLIAIATKINQLCSSEDCDHIPPVREAVALLKKRLGPNCSADDDKQKEKALTAFGNMGYHGDAHVDIVACIKDITQTRALRMLAIDAFRRMVDPIPRELLPVLYNNHEDSEVKIALFSSFLRHIDERQLPELKRIAEKERNKQVSSYMNTCIQNMNKTNSPMHQNIKKLLQNHEIHPKTGEYWTHSKNMELSTYNKALKVGGAVYTDLIHSDKNKMPIAMRTLFQVFTNESHFNPLEVGMRTQGLDEMASNIFALKDKIPNLDEIRQWLAQKRTPEEFKKAVKLLFQHKVFGDEKPEVTMFLRLLDTEVLRMSSSDLLKRNEMLKVAELMTKLAHGKDADFSHSVVFLNTKLIVPSVTGRSYSINLAGSSTVGLTAKAKGDILNLPRTADVHFHFQPSMNVEISTTFGFESKSHKPTMKHVSRMHFESDVDLKVEVRDGRIAIGKITLPSENVALVKMSTDIVEIDPDNNEKSIYEKRQKKIDYTFEHLNKPLGLIAHAKLDMPKPFLLKEFPYVVPSGNGEIALRRSDVNSYEVRFEIPKQSAPSMKYKASFDTPGSKVLRRFEAVVEVKQQRDQKDLLLELTSPFKTVGGRCSLVSNDKLTEGSLELHTSGKELVSANITRKVLLSASRRIYKYSGAYSILRGEPTTVDGTVAIIKGRKNHLSFDIKSNKPRSKPLALKGTFITEKQNGEGKFSSEVSLQSPAVDLSLRSTVEKQSKQSEVISAIFGIDYQLRGKEKHSLTISSTSQRSSNKVNTNAKLELTQYPRANMYLTWDRLSVNESFKNDIKLKYGQNPEKTYIHLKQRSHMPKKGPSHCSTSLDIPHRDIHYEINIDHEVDMRSEQPKINIGLDLCYKQDRHITAAIDVKCESKTPFKASGRLEFKSPEVQYIYEDGIIETNDSALEGNAKFQYIKGEVTKVSEIQYKYKKSIHDSKVHHEIESSIKTPLSRSPINNKASISVSTESLVLEGHVGPEYFIQAHWKKHGASYVNLKLPMLEGTVNATVKGTKKTINGDLKTKSRRLIVSAIADLGDRKKFEIRVQPDADRAPEKKIVASIGGEKKSGDSKDVITGELRLQAYDHLSVSLVGKGHPSFFGNQEFTLKVLTKNQERFTIRGHREIVHGHGRLTLAVSKNNVEKVKIDVDASQKQTRNGKDISVEISLISQDHSFEDTHIYLKNRITRSGSSQTIKTTISFKKNDKVYKTEWNSDIQSNGLEVKAEMQTPHVNYEQNAVGFSLQVSDSSLSSSVSITGLNNKKISIRTDIETKNHRFSLTSKINSENETISVLQVTLDNHRSKKSLEAYLDKNDKRILDIQGRMRKSSEEIHLEGSVKLSNLPEVKFRGLNVTIKDARSSALISANIQLINNEKISWISEIKQQDDVISASTSFATPRKNMKAYLSIENQKSKKSILSYLDINGERKGDVELTLTSSSHNMEVKIRSKTARTSEISAHLKYEKTGNSFLVTAIVMKGTSPLLSTSFNRLSHNGAEKLLMKTKSFEDVVLDLEISKEASGRNSDKYSLKAKGPFPDVHLTFSRNYNDKNSVSTELRVCRLNPTENCYSLKSHRKELNYRMDLEKSVGGSYSHTVLRLHLSVNAERPKLILEVNEKKYGSECILRRRQHDNDRCSLDCSLYTPSRTSRVRASILHNEHRINLEAHVIPSNEDPTRKLSLEVKKEINPSTKEISGFIKMSHPRMSQPLLLTCKIRPVGQDDHTPQLYYGKLVLHSGPVWGKTLTLEVLPNIDHEPYGIRSMEYKVYTDDKSIDAYLKLNIQNSRREKKIGYEWKYVSRNEEKKGGLALTLNDKDGGKTIKVSFSSPSANYEVQGSVADGPNDINLSIASAGRKLNEIKIKLQDSCAVIEFTKSAKTNPEFRSQICVNKPEEKRLQLLKVNVQYREHNCVDIRVSIDPHKPEYLDVIVKCNQDESCRALKEKIRELLRELQREIKQVVRQSKQEIKKVVRQSRQDVVEPLRKLVQQLHDYLSSRMEIVKKESIKKSKEIKEYLLKLMHSVLPTPLKELYQKYHQVVLREASRYYQKAKEILDRYCEIGWHCKNLKLALKSFSAKGAQMLIVRKLDELKQFFKFRMIYPKDIVNFITRGINRVSEFIEKRIIATFGTFIGKTIMHQIRKVVKQFEARAVEYSKKIEVIVREKIINSYDAVIEKIHHIFSQDEDLRTAKELILRAKQEIVNAWKNREAFAKSNAKRLESDIKENLKKLVDEQVEVLKYDPKEGEYKLKSFHFATLLRKLRELILRWKH